ncbi:hypothetical protein CIHG_10428 [Coccidioides immitis H538.4]|uniref:Uncharacterized protein n=1 Tax=Coccidioides immitis H538.4 TaxID=396776 RepID=A0A0J8S5A8_COCIT|nr:hypothetical protein CIHG_10428 [Coccidioides immitis H538.4]
MKLQGHPSPCLEKCPITRSPMISFAEGPWEVPVVLLSIRAILITNLHPQVHPSDPARCLHPHLRRSSKAVRLQFSLPRFLPHSPRLRRAILQLLPLRRIAPEAVCP